MPLGRGNLVRRVAVKSGRLGLRQRWGASSVGRTAGLVSDQRLEQKKCRCQQCGVLYEAEQSRSAGE